MTIREAQERVSLGELRSWKAFYRISPWDGLRGDHLVAMLASLIANVNRGKGSRAFSAEDFLPKWGTPAPQDPQAMENLFRAFVGMHNKAVEGS